MPTILVAGGAGFIGSHLCERLLGDGHRVVCFDNYQTGSEANILHLCEYPHFASVRHDVAIPFHAAGTEVYNLACPASPVHYQEDPIRTVRTNVLGAINMLDAARRLGARILQASTSEIYGDPAEHPQTEDYRGNVNPLGLRACYDEGKRCAETLFSAYHRQYGVDVRIARIFNTYGPRMHPRDGRVVPNFVVQALTGRPISVYGDGSQTRSFCHVSDMVEGLIRLMTVRANSPTPVNLGNPGEFTVVELAEMVLRLSKSSSRIIHKPLPEDDPRQRRPDITRAKFLLDWEPRMPLEEGLKDTIRHFRAILN